MRTAIGSWVELLRRSYRGVTSEVIAQWRGAFSKVQPSAPLNMDFVVPTGLRTVVDVVKSHFGPLLCVVAGDPGGCWSHKCRQSRQHPLSGAAAAVAHGVWEDGPGAAMCRGPRSGSPFAMKYMDGQCS